MIKLNSVSGLLFFVKDLDRTVAFYESVGFIFKTHTADNATAYLNWFWIEFVPRDRAEETVFQKQIDMVDAGNLFVHISVLDVDKFYEALLTKGLQPASEPKDFRWGRREFVLRDPDGYKLTFFSKT